jgi:triosephosphate isomerase
MRKKIVAGNWKMNKTLPEAQWLTAEIIGIYAQEINKENLTLIIAPNHTQLAIVGKQIADTGIALAAQDCHQATQGAYTGEVSAAMLQSVGTQYVIVGHSERRQYFGENEALLKQKVDACLAHNLVPIYCYGETQIQRENGSFFEIIKNQLHGALAHLAPAQAALLVLAYEPVWAIGTGLTATPAQAQEVHAFSRELLRNMFGNDIANQIPILYGGSVKPSNAPEIFGQTDIDGGLIGGASLLSRDFIDIAKAASIANN